MLKLLRAEEMLKNKTQGGGGGGGRTWANR
jgi:hypothetical protein